MDYSPPTEADRAWYRIVEEYLSQTTQSEANGRVPKLLKSSEEFGLMLPADMHRRAIHASLVSEFRTIERSTGGINFIDDDDGSDKQWPGATSIIMTILIRQMKKKKKKKKKAGSNSPPSPVQVKDFMQTVSRLED